MATFFVQRAGCFEPGKGKARHAAGAATHAAGAGAAGVCQSCSSSASPLTPPSPPPPPPLAPLSSLAIAVARAAHARGAAPPWHLHPSRSPKPGTSPFPKPSQNFSVGCSQRGLLHCAQLILKAQCIFMYLHTSPPLPSFSPFAIFFARSVFLSLSASPPAL